MYSSSRIHILVIPDEFFYGFNTWHFEFMASTLQPAITTVQMTDYTTRKLVGLGTFRPLTC